MGSNKPHLKALQESLLVFYKGKGLVNIIKTGTSESGWMIIDVDGIMIHLFDEELRDYYNLEDLWNDALKLLPKE